MRIAATSPYDAAGGGGSRSLGQGGLSKADLGLGILAAAIRLWYVWTIPPLAVPTENISVGYTLGQFGFFGNPFPEPTGPTAHVAPLYPALIAAFVFLTGSNDAGLFLARAAFAVPIGAVVALLPWAADRLGFGRATGRIASLLFLVPPSRVFLWIEVSGQHETVLTMAAFALLLPASIAVMRLELDWRRSAGLGFGWGLAMHASPTLVLPAIVTFAGAALLRVAEPARVRRIAIPAAAAFLMTVAPWCIRNYHVMGEAAFIRDNFGLELAVSNAADATADMQANILNGRTMTRHPVFSVAAAREMRALGEVEYYRRQGEAAFVWIRENPQRFLELTRERIRLFFLPLLALQEHAFLAVSLIVLWIAGTLYFLRVDLGMTLLLNGATMAYAAPHFLVQSSPRYPYPILWIMALFAGHVLVVSARWVIAQWRRAHAVAGHSQRDAA